MVIKKLIKDRPLAISVIIPIHIKNDKLGKVRKSVQNSTKSIEIIYVFDNKIADVFTKLEKYEKIIKIENKGRGFMFAEGVHHSTGEVIMFLHSDTILPIGWDNCITGSLKDKMVIGGGFKLKFDVENTYLNIAIRLLTFRSNPKKLLSGDRAIFVRSSLIKNNLSILKVPIMEDMNLSYLMRKNGDVKILDEQVTTSADAFLKNGILKHTIKIIISFFWYRIGGNLQEIYNFYYSKTR
jgi:glycosyltransferase involved in cell wall biosynthesis